MLLNTSKIREDFPIFKRKINGYPLIYFDNAATSQKPIQVINAIKEFYETHNANIHRGIHTLSQEASDFYDNARRKTAKLINAKEEEIIFVRNTTEAINFVAYTWALKNIGKNDEIIITRMEHHSNILPWRMVTIAKKAKLKIVNILSDGTLDYNHFNSLVSKSTKLVAITHVSNVLGTINDIEYIIKRAHEFGAKVFIDGAQSVPHLPIDVKRINMDFLAFSGHKMLGPTGIGVLYVKKDIEEELNPFLSGGGAISDVSCNISGCSVKWAPIPLKFEAGTPNIAGAVGLAAAVNYLLNIGIDNIKDHEQKLTKITLERLSEIDKIKLYGTRKASIRSGIVTFNVIGLYPHEVAAFLDHYGIAVRSGHHCALPLHKTLGADNGTVRASFYLYNTIEEVEFFIDKIKDLCSRFD